MQRLREARGLSQERVAYDSGMSRYTYQKFEKGESMPGTPANPSLRNVMAIARPARQVGSPPSRPLAPLGRRWQESWVARLPRFSALCLLGARNARSPVFSRGVSAFARFSGGRAVALVIAIVFVFFLPPGCRSAMRGYVEQMDSFAPIVEMLVMQCLKCLCVHC